MILRQSTVGLVPVAILAVSGLCATANAQSTLNFSLTYNTEFLFPPLDENLEPDFIEVLPLIENLPPEFEEVLPENLPPVLPVSGSDIQLLDVTVTGESVNPNPSFGLTNFTSNTFGLSLPPQTDPSTGQPTRQLSIFRANPADLNIDLPTPEFADVYFGDGTENKLFGLANDQAIFDFVEGTVSGGGIITIVGGEGIFEGATGRIDFTQEDELGPPGEPVRGQARLDFFVQVPQTVPEPGTNATLIIGALGAALILSRRQSP